MVKIVLLFTILLLSTVLYVYARPVWVPVYQKVVGKQTVDDVVAEHSQIVFKQLSPYFERAGINYPPKQITLLAIKDQKLLELWAKDLGEYKYIRTYKVQAASGVLGPKLREGDTQVPEGIYSLEYLNPNSSYHLSMKMNYPNSFDLEHALAEGRSEPGSNIFIHGKALSIGCLAMGDEAIEELFVLTALVGKDKVQVAVAPIDPRKHNLLELADGQAAWVVQLYNNITNYFENFRREA